MEKKTINTIITNTGRVAAGISVVIAFTMDTILDVARKLTGLAFLGFDAAYLDVAQRFVFAMFPILYLLFSLIPAKSLSRVLSIGAAGMQVLIGRQFIVNVIDLIGRRASDMKTATVFYMILGVLAIIFCIAGFFTNQIHALVNIKGSAKKSVQPVAAPSNNANYYNPYNM